MLVKGTIRNIAHIAVHNHTSVRQGNIIARDFNAKNIREMLIAAGVCDQIPFQYNNLKDILC